MPKGWDGVEAQTRETQERRDAAGNFLPSLRVNDKNQGPFTIRFLEQGADVNNYAVHEYKVQEQGGTRNRNFTCLNQAPWNLECPGCKAGWRRKTRGVFNIIQRQRPVLRKGADDKALKDAAGNYIVDGHRDEVVVANVGGPTAEMLRQADGSYQGLMMRDFVVTYSGNTFQAWNMAPAVDAAGNSMPTPLSEADLALAASKFDLDDHMKPPSFQEAAQIVVRHGGGGGGGVSQPAPSQAQPVNTMAERMLQGSNVDPSALPEGGAFGAATQAPQQTQQG